MRTALLVAGTALLCSSLVGCQGSYRGDSISPAARKVVLFEIEGPYGTEFTELLATELTSACKRNIVVVKASEVPQLANPGNSATASYIRDLGAQAYIKGKITRSERIQLIKYSVTGNFQLYDSEKEGVVGGVPHAAYSGDLDPGTNWLKGNVEPSQAQKVHQTLASWVARQLARGLGHR